MPEADLFLKRSAEQETVLRQLIDQQQDKSSSNYLRWLTPEDFGAAFGPSDRDLSAVTTWLSSQGFSDIQVSAGQTFLEFNGTVGAVRAAFRTSIHCYNANGQEHFANSSDPEIPSALAPVVAGIASLNSFPRRAANRRLGTFRRDSATSATTSCRSQPLRKRRRFLVRLSPLAAEATPCTASALTTSLPFTTFFHSGARTPPSMAPARTSRFSTLFIAGCGSAVTAGQAVTAGAYAVTVAATGGPTVQVTTITLTIQ